MMKIWSVEAMKFSLMTFEGLVEVSLLREGKNSSEVSKDKHFSHSRKEKEQDKGWNAETSVPNRYTKSNCRSCYKNHLT